MTERGSRLLVRGALLGVLVFQGWLLLPERDLHPVPLNDDAFHVAASLKARDLMRGDPSLVLDPWFSYWSLGYPLWHAYQPLPHLVTGAAGLLVSDDAWPAFFGSLKLLLLLAFPFCVFVGARWIGLGDAASAAAAALAPLAATDGLYGLEYGSYLWRGSGLYAQLWAADLLPLAVGRGVAALRGRARPAGAGALTAATFLCHAVYGYVAAISLAVAAFVLRRERGGAAAAGRLLAALAAAGWLAAWFLLPMLLDREAINHSRWEAAWKWDSFGHEWVLSRLAAGGLFDHGRLPVLTALALAGAALALRRREPAHVRVVGAGFVAWLCLYFGRPTWGMLLTLAGVPQDAHLHRLIGAVHLFGILAGGLALGRLIGLVAGTWPRAARWALGALLLAPVALAAAERRAFVRQGDAWAAESERAVEAERGSLDALVSQVRRLQAASPGRVYPGLAAGWGRDFKLGAVPVYAFLSLARVDALAFLYHAMSLTSDVMVLFEEGRPIDYDVFDVRYAIMDASRPAPPFLRPAGRSGRFALYEAPSSGRVGAGALAFAALGGRADVHGFASAWLQSALPEARQYGAILPEDPGRGGPRLLRPGDPMPDPGRLAPAPRAVVRAITRAGDDWSAEVEMEAAGVVFLKETYHPGWRVEIDGARARPVMVTPGFVGAEIPAGRHAVSFRYRPGLLKWTLFLLGPAAFGLLASVRAALRRRPGRETREEQGADGGVPAARAPAPSARSLSRILLAGIALAGALPLLQSALVAGHDALEYPPRLVEFHENVRHGRLLPVWAPDLGNGHGQPLFLFSPPLFYGAAEIFHAAGAGLAPSIHLAAIAFYAAAGLGAFLAGRRLWGRAGGLVASAGYLVSPYLLLDLYVRANFAELAAVALFPWAAWGLFGLREAPARGAAALAASVALVALAHNGALLIVLAWLGVTAVTLAAASRDARFLARAAGAAALGLGLAAFFWIPCAAHLGDSKAHLLRADFLDHSRHFVEPGQLLHSPWGYGLSVPGAEDGMSFSVGLLHLGLAIAGGVVLKAGGAPRGTPGRGEEGRRCWTVLLAVAALFAVMTTPAAAAIWKAAPPLQYLAYPWRLLAAVSLSLSLAAGALAAERPRRPGPRGWMVVAAALAALLVWGLPKARPKGHVPFDDAYFSPSRIASQGINTTTREEYEPRWVAVRPPPSEREIEVLEGLAFVRSREGTPWDRRFRLAVEEPSRLVLRLFYFPGWRVEVDGAPAEPEIEPDHGRIVVEVPEGDHVMRVRLADTWPRAAGKATSAASVALAAALWARARRRRRGASSG